MHAEPLDLAALDTRQPLVDVLHEEPAGVRLAIASSPSIAGGRGRGLTSIGECRQMSGSDKHDDPRARRGRSSR